MQECSYFSRDPEILVDKQFVFVNLLNLFAKQMQLAFLLWFKKRKGCWPDFAALVSKGQTRVATLMLGLLV